MSREPPKTGYTLKLTLSGIQICPGERRISPAQRAKFSPILRPLFSILLCPKMKTETLIIRSLLHQITKGKDKEKVAEIGFTKINPRENNYTKLAVFILFPFAKVGVCKFFFLGLSLTLSYYL